MFKLWSLCLLATFCHLYAASEVTNDDTELVFAFMVLRHGDRTLSLSSETLATDVTLNEAVEKIYGEGQLINTGIQRAYHLGTTIRKLYNEIISEKYNRSEIYIQSTDFTRAKMTILTALAYIFPGGDQDDWSRKINWTPVPYTLIPPVYDPLLFVLNCPEFTNPATSVFLRRPEAMNQFQSTLEALTNYYNGIINFTEVPLLIFGVNDVLTAELSMGIQLPDEIDSIYEDIVEATDVALETLFGAEDIIPITGGWLLNEFFTYANLIISGADTPKVRIYSAHDANVYGFQASTAIANKQGVPYFTALYSLELRKVKDTGKYVVKPVYVPAAGEDPVDLQVKDCDQLCDFETFVNITSQYAVNTSEWRNLCDWTEDQVVPIE